MIGNWVQVQDSIHHGITVHEVKCPICKHKETYHFIPPAKCYICDAELSIKEAENEDSN